MRHYVIKIVLLTVTLIFFSACGDDSASTDTNTIPSTCENNISWGSCGLPEFIQNPVEAYNLLGIYGDHVYLGDKKIVGSWQLYDMDENGSKIEPSTYTLSSFDFSNDGTGQVSSLQTDGHEIDYGVAPLGYTLLTSYKSGLPIIYSIYSQKDDCFLVVKQSANYFLDTTTHYLCKIR